jgi:formylglycine-generating enzyme required for sulfatase activity
MSGNVWEWTSTDYEPYPYDAADGRENESSTAGRVVRGGSFDYASYGLRGANRLVFDPINDYNFVGFRCVRPPSQ